MESNMHMLLTRMMEEKHTFTYKKLVVPMSMRSIYWKYFGFPATDEGEILTRVKIVCILCKSQITYNRNTSNLRMHLQNKHAHELVELEASAPPRRPSLDPKEKRAFKKLKLPGMTPHIYTTSADGTVQIEGDIQFITDPNITLQNVDDDSSSNQNVRVVLKGNAPTAMGGGGQNVAIILPEDNGVVIDGKTISDAIAEFIILDLQLPDVVEGRGFQRLVATLRSPCEIPSKTKLEDEIVPKIYETFRDSVASNLCNLNGEVALSLEEWNLASGEAYVTFSVHYQPGPEPTMETKVLTTVHCAADMDCNQWGVVTDTIFQEWDLKPEHVTAVVTATLREELLDVLSQKGLALVPCLVHSLQLCASACFEQHDVALVLNKCRAVIALIVRNTSASANLRLQEQMMQLEDTPLSSDYPKVWTSTYIMLEQLVIRRNIIQTVLETSDIVDKEAYMLNDMDWKVVEDLVMVLEPFKVTIMTLSEEKIPLISLLKPLLWQLNSSHLKVKDTDSECAQNFKCLLSETLSARYSDSAIELLLQTATTLDPRFKLLPYASDEDKSIISGPIKQMLVSYVEEDRGGCCAMGMGESPSKKSRLSGMEFLLGDLCSSQGSMPAEERANLELVQYQSETAAALDQCPLQWWARASAKCPSLARLARKYNCVPACAAVPTQRINMDTQVLFSMRRASLAPHLADKMLFLNGNHSV